MKFSDFKIGWRLLVGEPGWSLVTLFGLAVGFAASFLLLGYAWFSFSYDGHIANATKIQVVKTKIDVPGMQSGWIDAAIQALGVAMEAKKIPALISMFSGEDITARTGLVQEKLTVTLVNPAFLEMTGLKARQGDLTATLQRPDAIALTETTARKFFGRTDVIGKTIQSGGATYVVTALVADPPANTNLAFDALADAKSGLRAKENRDSIETNWGRVGGYLLVMPKAGASLTQLTAMIQNIGDHSPMINRLPPSVKAKLVNGHLYDFKLVSLKDFYLDPDLAGQSLMSDSHANEMVVLGLCAIAILIALMAAANYINLATVRTLRRQREIAMRKILGANTSRVVTQFLSESILVSMLAMALGLLLAWILLPTFDSAMNRTLDSVFGPMAFIVSFLAALIVGLLAGAWPAWTAVQLRATEALVGRGQHEASRGAWARRVLTIAQFACAMGLSAITMAISWQTWHSTTSNPGFDPGPLLVVSTIPNGRAPDPQSISFVEALKHEPNVEGVAFSPSAVGNDSEIHQSDIGRTGIPAVDVDVRTVSASFFDVYKVHVLVGRPFDQNRDHNDKTSGILISNAASKSLGFATPADAVGQTVSINDGREQRQIIGVAADVAYKSARTGIKPAMYVLGDHVSLLTVRVKGPLEPVEARIAALWKQYQPNYVLDMDRASNVLNNRYIDDHRLAALLLVATFVGMAIAAFGIYVLAAYSVQRRTREIVLRRLYGAGHRVILRLVTEELALMVAIAAAISLPIANVSIARYLAHYTEHAPIGGWTLAAALGLATLLGLLATWRHLWQALSLRPAQALLG